MQIRFLRTVRVFTEQNICCFSGGSDVGQYTFMPNTVINIHAITLGDDDVTKDKIYRKHGAQQVCDLVMDNINKNCTHPDVYKNVPFNAFEVLPTKATAKQA